MKRSKRQPGIGTIIAHRVLKEKGPRGKEVVIHLGRPRRGSKAAWECPFLIDGLGEKTVQTAPGVDALQALLLAIAGIRANLDRARRELTWLDDDELGPDIPRFIPTQYGRLFEERIRQVIERDTDRYWRVKYEARKKELAEREARLKVSKENLALWKANLDAPARRKTNAHRPAKR
jgi:uncharacterized protein DUF6968